MKAKINYKTIATNLAFYRQQLGYSFKELAAATGLSASDLQAYEKQEKKPSGDVILILSGFYKVGYMDLLFENLSKETFEGLDDPKMKCRLMSKRFFKRNGNFLMGLLPESEQREVLDGDGFGDEFFGLFEDEADVKEHLEYHRMPAFYASLCFRVYKRDEFSTAKLKELLLHNEIRLEDRGGKGPLRLQEKAKTRKHY